MNQQNKNSITKLPSNSGTINLNNLPSYPANSESKTRTGGCFIRKCNTVFFSCWSYKPCSSYCYSCFQDCEESICQELLLHLFWTYLQQNCRPSKNFEPNVLQHLFSSKIQSLCYFCTIKFQEYLHSREKTENNKKESGFGTRIGSMKKL